MNQLTSSTYLSPYYQENRVLTREEAKLRLHKLTPGSEEYHALQGGLLKTVGIVKIYLSTTTYKVDCCPSDWKLLGGFGPSEHVAIGKSVKLKFPKSKDEKDEVPSSLFSRDLTAVRFEDIVALAGDFYGVAWDGTTEGAVSLPGGTSTEKMERFRKAFETLYQADSDELEKILSEITHECHQVENSSFPHHCYSSLLMEQSNAIGKIKKDIHKLLQDNSDHFYKQAADTYAIGHTYALIVARDAGKEKNEEGLKKAYAIDAFACHFLTDLFSAGHIRNQRGELETFLVDELKFTKEWAKPLAGLLTAAQHEKDGNDGLNVSNSKGDRWRAYGDGCFFLPKNKENKNQAIKATQASIDEIYEVYCDPDAETYSKLDAYESKVLDLIPSPISFNPLPLYTITVENDLPTLTLHQVQGESISITKDSWKIKYLDDLCKIKYLKDGLCYQALKYLPESYVNSYISSYVNPVGKVEIPILEKVIIPQIERITGYVWHVIGVSTYHQVKEENQKLNEKIDEMASVVNEIYKNSSEILDYVKVNQDILKKLVLQEKFKSLEESIKKIKTQIKKCRDLQTNITKEQMKTIQKILFEEIWKLLTELEDPCGILTAYSEQLQETLQEDKLQIKIAITLWFRHVLGYQSTAFDLYETIQRTRGENISGQRGTFESNLMKQIMAASKDHIDEELVYYPPYYIEFQIEKHKIKMKAIEHFKSIEFKN
jgi:hypothetical protein